MNTRIKVLLFWAPRVMGLAFASFVEPVRIGCLTTATNFARRLSPRDPLNPCCDRHCSSTASLAMGGDRW